MASENELEARWVGFIEKVEARIPQVAAEAAEAFADVAQQAPLNPAPIAAIEGALQARFRGLSDKVDDAWEKIDDQLDELTDDTENATRIAKLATLRDTLCERGRVLNHTIDLEAEICRVTSLAEVGRALQRLANSEVPEVTCTQCGSPIDIGTTWQTKNVPCPGCGAINAVGPGPATMQWYSRGTGYLVEETALGAWRIYRAAEAHYDDLRHPLPADLEELVTAYEAYHRARTDALVSLHPAWTQAKADAEVTGFVGKLRGLHKAQADGMSRIAEGLQIASKRDPKQVERWAASHVGDLSRSIVLDDLLEAAVERGLRPEASTLVQVVHKDEVPWLFGKDRWVRTKLRELSPAFA